MRLLVIVMGQDVGVATWPKNVTKSDDRSHPIQGLSVKLSEDRQ